MNGTNISAQKYTIKGYVEDHSSGEKLYGANIYDAKTYNGTTSNNYGFFSLTLPKDTIQLTVSYVGYGISSNTFYLDRDTTINLVLNSSIELKEVEISASKTESIQEQTRMSTIDIPMNQIKTLPVFMGEKDVLKTVQLLPGVQSGGEGSSGLYVRGGGPDQNLILLDGVPVYNASHLFGFFSVFNPDAINSVQLVKGGFPARYGGRLSSILDIRMKEGNSKQIHGEGSIGLVASKMTLEGPIKKDKTSFIISGRRTYIDLLTMPIIRAASNKNGQKVKTGYYFYDLNAKINHKISDKSRLFLSAYLGNDKAYANFEESYNVGNSEIINSSNAKLGWGNITTAFRWNYLLSKKIFSNITLTYSRYRFIVNEDFKTTEIQGSNETSTRYNYEYFSGIYDVGGKVDFDYLPSPNHFIKFGIGNIYHTFTPGISTFEANDNNITIDTSYGSQSLYAHESSVYIEDDIKIGGRLKTNLGVHFSGFLVKEVPYYSVQPRISARYLLTDEWSLKASGVTMTQYIHLLTNATVGLPTDLWVPVTDMVKPLQSMQFALGVAHTLKEQYEISMEVYYKTMDNLIEYKEGATFFSAGTDWQNKVEMGRGWAYGSELFLQKKIGKLSGWLGYTLSWSERLFDNLNFGKKFPYKFDRRHDISIAIIYNHNERIDAGLVWVYGTGNAITLPTSRYMSNLLDNQGYSEIYAFGDNTIEHFDSRNDYRMPAYHRLDLGINFHKKKKRGERTWSFGIYNAYSRKNPFYLYFGVTESGNRVLKQVSLFPFIPSVTYSFKF